MSEINENNYKDSLKRLEFLLDKEQNKDLSSDEKIEIDELIVSLDSYERKFLE